MEADGETPWQACQREVREECGIELGSGRLACMDFRLPRDGNPGGIRFLFDCGTLDDAAFLDIILQEEEISAHRLVPMPEALTLLRGPIRRRVKAVRTRHGKVRKHPVRYLENGRKVPGVHR
jgi:8-oxo-dGTP pyrophosphatase MutT (NUDIX family)